MTLADIALAEKSMRIKLPDDYRAFLLEHNGGIPDPACFRIGEHGGSMLDYFYSIDPTSPRTDLVRNRSIYRKRIPSALLPIACDQGGNMVCIGIAKKKHIGRIYFWQHDSSGYRSSFADIIAVADSLGEFIDGFYEIDV